MTAFAAQLFFGHLGAVQRVGDRQGHRRGFGGGTVVVHIHIIGIPGHGVDVLLGFYIGFDVLDIRQVGKIGDTLEPAVVMQPAAHRLALGAAVRIQNQIHAFLLGQRGVLFVVALGNDRCHRGGQHQAGAQNGCQAFYKCFHTTVSSFDDTSSAAAVSPDGC